MGWIMMLVLAAAAASAEPVASAKDGGADLGKKVFAAKCSTCHGKDAKGKPSMAKMFKLDPAKLDLTSEVNQKKTDAELTKAITDGNGKMPSFKGKLKDAEIGALVSYTRTLAPKPAAKSEVKEEAKPEATP